MIPTIVYPLPLDNWDVFKPEAERFASTWKEFPPGCPCRLMCVAKPTNMGAVQLQDIFEPLRKHDVEAIRLERYTNSGADIGAHQHAAQMLDDDVMVCLSTRVHFHRAGWLKRLVDSWEEYGPGLYGTAATRETGRKCLRTHCYMVLAADLRRYPHLINTRARGYFFEWGDGNPDGSFTRWYENLGGMTRIVYWDSCSDIEWFAQDNIFRRGDQSNLVVWDRHTQLWAEAADHEKKVLSTMCFGLETRNGEV